MKIISSPQPDEINKAWECFSAFISTQAYRIASIALRVLAFCCRTIGCLETATSLKYSAKKIYTLNITHNYKLSAHAPFPLLTRSKNVAKKTVITNEEDTKAARAMRKVFFGKDLIECKQLKNSSLKGAYSKGICFGATLHFIKRYLAVQPKSEEELIALAKEFEDGFDSEAAAIQAIYNKTIVLRNQMIKPTNCKLEHLLKTSIAELKQLSKQPFNQNRCIKMSEVIFAMQEKSKPLLKSLQEIHVQFLSTKITPLIGLSYEQKDIRLSEKQNPPELHQIEHGAYSLFFTAHAVSLILTSFGSYIFDPNYGLMSISKIPLHLAIKTLHSKYDPSDNIRIGTLQRIT